MKRLCLAALLVVTATLPIAPGTSWAAHPGANGRVAMMRMPNFGNNEVTIVSVAADGSDERLLIGSEHNPGIPAYSPDGSRLAFGCAESTTEDLCIADEDGSNVETIVSKATTKDPDWSPDGRRLVTACTIRRSRDSHICTVGLNGRGLAVVAKNSLYPAWSSRNLLAYRSSRAARDGIVVSKPDGSRKRTVVASTETHMVQELDWAPGGRRLVYVAGNRGLPRIFTVRRNGTHRRRVAVGVQPTFSPDGDWILFLATGGLYVIRPNGEDKRLLVEEPDGATDLFFDWQPLPES